MDSIVLYVVVVLTLFFSFGIYFTVKLIKLKAEATEQAIVRRLEQLYAMQYNSMLKQGWNLEDLRDMFPTSIKGG